MKAGNDKNGDRAAARLRRQAEEKLSANSPQSGNSRPDAETQQLIHELQIHQIELEMQNSELQHARDELEMALEKYTDLYDFAPVGYFSCNDKGFISAVNLTGASMLGSERARLLGRRFGLLLTQESQSLFAAFLDKVFANQGKTSCEVTLVTEGNLPLVVQIDAVLFGSGQECRAVLMDITARKQAEERIAHKASFPQLNPNPVLEVDVSGRIIFFNPAAVKAMEAFGMNAGDVGVFIPTDLAAIVESWDRLHEATFYREVTIHDLIFAESIYLNTRFKTVRIYAYDITERRKAEQKLHDSEERLRLALSAAQLAAWDWHLPSGTIVWNDEHYRMLGYEPGGVVPSYRAWADRMHPDDIVATEARIRECMAAGSAYAAEFRVLWPDGTVRWLEGLGEFISDDAGQPLRSYGVMMDRTSQAQAEAALQQAYLELADANIDLEAFNYSVSHDLRSPLTVVSGYCQMVQEMCGSSLDERCRGYIGEMYEATLRMTRLIETLLDFSSVTRIEMHHEKVNLSKIAEEVAMVLQKDSPERRVTFRIAAGITVDGDAVLLRSVLDNLMGNAWKYAGNRDGVVIEFGATESDGKSACFVKDNGPGFDSAHLDKLFLPFQRLPGTKVGGHGIGLATVDRIIRRHGGRVWAEGEPGKGACFYFTLVRGWTEKRRLTGSCPDGSDGIERYWMRLYEKDLKSSRQNFPLGGNNK